MQESTILKTALICSIIGLTALFLFFKTIEPDTVMIGNLDQMTDMTIMIEGTVLGISGTESVTYIMLEKSETTTVIFFGPTPYLETGDYVQAKGTAAENQKGQTEVIGDEIRVI